LANALLPSDAVTQFGSAYAYLVSGTNKKKSFFERGAHV
jgi:hypothetical protein